MADKKRKLTDDRTGVPLPYDAPRLRVYGAVAALTRNVGKNGTTADSGGHGNMRKTS